MISLLSRVRSNQAQITQSIEVYFLIQTQGHCSPVPGLMLSLLFFFFYTSDTLSCFLTLYALIFARAGNFACQYSYSQCGRGSSGEPIRSQHCKLLFIDAYASLGTKSRCWIGLKPQDKHLGWADTGRVQAQSHSEPGALKKNPGRLLCVGCVWCWWNGIAGMDGSSLQHLCWSRILLP